MRMLGRCALVGALLVCSQSASAQTVEGRLAALVDEAGFVGSAMITRGEATILSQSIGMANLEHGVPNTSRTKFRIGSITKQFTAAAILILQDRGFVSGSDPVSRYLPSGPAAWEDITVHQLLTHTSGLMHSWPLPGFRETMALPTTLDETLKRFYDEPLLFPPGSGYAYSGTGYFLLAKIIEVASGKSYGQFLQEEIFDPLGMRETGSDRPDMVLADRASGYQRGEDGVVRNAPHVFMPLLTGGGNLYSTVEDLTKWHRALMRQELISESGYAEMYRPERDHYAYGWQIGEIMSRKSVSHGGYVPGFVSFLLRVPDEDLCIVLLANHENTGLEDLARSLASTVLAGH